MHKKSSRSQVPALPKYFFGTTYIKYRSFFVCIGRRRQRSFSPNSMGAAAASKYNSFASFLEGPKLERGA